MVSHVNEADKFKFSTKALKQLVNDENSGVKVCRNCCRGFQLKAKYVGSVVEGISNYLKSNTPHYDTELDGLVLDYKCIKIHAPIFAQDRTLYDSTIAIKVSFDIYYAPFTLSSVLKGKVTVVEDKHIICLVHNIFNVSVLRPYSIPFDEWSGSSVNVGDTVTFKVTVKLLREDIPYIQGELIDDGSGALQKIKQNISSDDEE